MFNSGAFNSSGFNSTSDAGSGGGGITPTFVSIAKPCWYPSPVGDILETLQWKTDVIQTFANEQRFALRSNPRRKLKYKHTLNSVDVFNVRELLKSEELLFPVWTNPLWSGTLAVTTFPVVTSASAASQLSVGDYVFVFNTVPGGFPSYGVAAVTAILGNDITLDANGIGDPVDIYPCLNCTTLSEHSITRHLKKAMSLEVTGVSKVGKSLTTANINTLETYKGLPIIRQANCTSLGNTEESYISGIELLDNSISLLEAATIRSLDRHLLPVSWFLREEAKYQEILTLLQYCKGQWKPFWLPDHLDGFRVLTNLVSGYTTIKVAAPNNVHIVKEAPFTLEVGMLANATQLRVVAVNIAPNLAGVPAYEFELETPLTVNVAKEEIKSLSYLHCVRLASDQIEILHLLYGGKRISTNVLEVPL